MFPQDVIEKSYLVLNINSIRYRNYLNYIGFLPEKAVFLNNNEWAFAFNLYTPVDPIVYLAHYGKLADLFAKKIRSYFNITNLIPDKYFITNRGPRQTRHIENMQDVLEAFNSKYPDKHFSILEDINNFDEAAYLWGSAKLIFGPTGSNLFKHYAMASKTILIVIASNLLDIDLAMGAAAHDVFCLFLQLPNMPQFSFHRNILNITEAFRVLEIGLYCLDHGHFDPNETFRL